MIERVSKEEIKRFNHLYFSIIYIIYLSPRIYYYLSVLIY